MDLLSCTRDKGSRTVLTAHAEPSACSRLELRVGASSAELHTVVGTGVCWGDVTDADGKVRVVSPRGVYNKCYTGEVASFLTVD